MSISSGDIEDDTYALFGGYNSTQIVGGEYGLATFRNNHYDYKSAVKSWALPSRDLLYGGESVGYNKQTVEYPAIIDTGSSFLAVPGDEFTALSEKWKQAVPNLDCKDTFCQTSNSCDEIAGKLKPVSFQIDEVVFDMSPKSYLH